MESNTIKNIWKLLHEVPDPEIPVISVVDLGVIRKVDLGINELTITITPTYTGCPAMKQFEVDIVKKLNDNGFPNVTINTVLHPAWTTNWMNDAAKEKLRKYGIAPPIDGTEDKGVLFSSNKKKVPCPRCSSDNTILKSQFGSTACKSLYQCNNCLETFDHFKCI